MARGPKRRRRRRRFKAGVGGEVSNHVQGRWDAKAESYAAYFRPKRPWTEQTAHKTILAGGGQWRSKRQPDELAILPSYGPTQATAAAVEV